MKSISGIDHREAYGSINMGARFALYVAHHQAEAAASITRRNGVAAWVAGQVETGPRQVVIEALGLTYFADELHVRA